MVTTETEAGVEITRKVPIVDKGERLDVSFEIKGEGEIDAEALNRFHGAHFGDELETEDDSTDDVEEASEESEEVQEETTEEVSEESESESEDAEEPEQAVPEIKFREDIMLRVMEEYGITDRDAFLAHSMNFDLDDNGYLKKAEFVEAAKAFTAEGEAEAEDSTEDASQEDEPATSSEDSESGEAESSEQEAKNCPICGTSNAHDAAACVACNYTFE